MSGKEERVEAAGVMVVGEVEAEVKVEAAAALGV